MPLLCKVYAVRRGHLADGGADVTFHAIICQTKIEFKKKMLGKFLCPSWYRNLTMSNSTHECNKKKICWVGIILQ